MQLDDIPLCFKGDEWCLLEGFVVKDGILVAYASDYYFGPLDYVGFNANNFPFTSLNKTVYDIMIK